MTNITNSEDLLTFLSRRAKEDGKNWFSYSEQRLTGITLAHQIAAAHADKFTPEEVVDYVVRFNNAIYKQLILGNKPT